MFLNFSLDSRDNAEVDSYVISDAILELINIFWQVLFRYFVISLGSCTTEKNDVHLKIVW